MSSDPANDRRIDPESELLLWSIEKVHGPQQLANMQVAKTHRMTSVRRSNTRRGGVGSRGSASHGPSTSRIGKN
jgi:hypothetical protein